MKDFKVASIRRIPTRIPTDSYSKKPLKSKFKNWLCEKAFHYMQKWGFLNTYFDETPIETFSYDEVKRKLITEKILDAIRLYGRDYNENINPENYIVIMGETTFFEVTKEDRNDSPFFGSTATFMSNDIYYSDPYRGKRVMNFQVHVVPAMQGFALVPRVLIEKKV